MDMAVNASTLLAQQSGIYALRQKTEHNPDNKLGPENRMTIQYPDEAYSSGRMIVVSPNLKIPYIDFNRFLTTKMVIGDFEVRLNNLARLLSKGWRNATSSFAEKQATWILTPSKKREFLKDQSEESREAAVDEESSHPFYSEGRIWLTNHETVSAKNIHEHKWPPFFERMVVEWTIVYSLFIHYELDDRYKSEVVQEKKLKLIWNDQSYKQFARKVKLHYSHIMDPQAVKHSFLRVDQGDLYLAGDSKMKTALDEIIHVINALALYVESNPVLDIHRVHSHRTDVESALEKAASLFPTKTIPAGLGRIRDFTDVLFDEIGVKVTREKSY